MARRMELHHHTQPRDLTRGGPLGRGALLLVAGFFLVGAVIFANYVIKAARWFIKDRRLAKRRAEPVQA